MRRIVLFGRLRFVDDACVTGRCTKEGQPCPVCGGPVPPSRGVKPRRFCSAACCRRNCRPPRVGSKSCADCGDAISQPPSKGRKRIVCSQCKITRKRNARAAVCLACGLSFRASSPRKSFCSQNCRWKSRPAASKCVSCGADFQQARVGQLCCSRACGHRASMLKRNQRPPRVYQCLNCGAAFHKRPYRVVNKYCCRGCAFEHRRIRSDGSPASQLVAWFYNWGADHTPAKSSPPAIRTNHKSRCERFGVPYEPVSRRRVFEAAGWRCRICNCELLKYYTVIGGRVDPRSPTVDCVVPLSAGRGTPGYVYSNVQAACHACNVRKADSFVLPHPTSLD